MATENRKELVVYGFIRNIHNIMSEKRIIPIELIQTCYTFYCVSLKIVISTESKLFIANIDNKTISQLLPTGFTTKNALISACYVPDISQHISMKHISMKSEYDKLDVNKHYDGLVGIHAKWNDNHQKYYPCVVLFESDAISHKNINCHIISSFKPAPDNESMGLIPPHLIYCNHINGVICCGFTELYQLKLKHIDSTNFNFKQTASICLGSTIGYIYGTKQLFEIERYIPDLYRLSILKEENEKRKNAVSCRIFDFNKNEWNNIKRFEYTQYANAWFMSTVCKHNEYNNNVYIVSSIGHTAIYDTYKDDWIMLFQDIDDEELIFNDKPTVWMDGNPNILYCNYQEYNAYFDIRDNNKWQKNQEMNFMFDSIQDSSFKLFL